MSNVYIQEPPALGKVLLKTTAGDIDLELWTKEAPKACRNFIQLCIEGYYNGTIFHRVVPDFIVQGGDPNGDGTGGESIYGAPFKDEFHSRLRFNRRGLVASANAGKDDNGSQFFFTLSATPELQNKHTIFGKVTGETIFNMLKLAEGEIGEDERPVYPQRITRTEVVINPFEDIVPRVAPPSENTSKPSKSKERQGTKNFGLLSFGAEAEEDEDEAVEFRGKAKSTHDLLDDPKLSKKTAAELNIPEGTPPRLQEEGKGEPSAAVSSVRDKLKSKKKVEEQKEARGESDSEGEYYLGKDKDIARRKERDRIRNEISQLKKDMKKPKSETDASKEESLKLNSEENNELKKQYEEEQEKYKKLKEKIPKKGSARQDYTLALLEKFKTKLSAMKEKSSEAADFGATKEPANEDDINSDDWLTHKLHFEDQTPVLAKDASTKGDDWFDIYDPRNPLNKRRREQGGAGGGGAGSKRTRK